MKLLFSFIIVVILFTGGIRGNPASSIIKDHVIPNYRRGIDNYQKILNHLSTNDVSDYNEAQMQGWAETLRASVNDMGSALNTSLKHTNRAKDIMNKRAVSLAKELTAKDEAIKGQNTRVAQLNTQVNGKQADVNRAALHLQNAQNGLASHERAVADAEKKYNKSKNKCFRRKKRSVEETKNPKQPEEVDDSSEDDNDAELSNKRNVLGEELDEFTPEEQQLVLKRVKRGWLKKVGKAVAKPFEKVGKAARKGICRGLGALTGQIKKAKKLRDRARGERDAARNTLNARTAELNNLKTALSNARTTLSNAQKRATTLRSERTVLTGQITQAGQFGKDVKKAVEFLQRIFVRSTVLKDTLGDMTIFDAETLLNPLNEAGKVLQQKFQAASFPIIPKPSSTVIAKIKETLKKLNEILPNFPLIEIDE